AGEPPALELTDVGPDRIPRKPFGRTGERVSVIGIGGYSLGDAPALQEAIAIVHEAIDAGVTFFDNAWEYHDGKSEDWMGQAKKAGKVRYVGFTGHKHPAIHLKMLSYGYPFDSVQMPLNAFDATYRSFQTHVLPEVAKRGMAGLGMKSLGGNGQPIIKGVVTVEEALRYAMSLPVASTISGIDSLAVLHQNLAIARGFQPMTAVEMEKLQKRCAP